MDAITEERKNWLSVSEVSSRIKKVLLQDSLLGGTLTVKGELSNVKASSRGHVYFTLKDDKASLSCVMWASIAQKLRFTPENGLEVFARGNLDLYAPSGTYSLVAESLNPVGLGDLKLAYEQLKTLLESEGLFDTTRKKALPAFPLKIGIVTAKTGAVLHDMVRTIRERNSLVSLVLAPVPVQGEGAAPAIAEALLRLADKRLKLDAILLARGGGSFEDLFCFNEAPVVRAVALSSVPVVTGLGHEPDYTLADAAADYSAATPTAAAAYLVPDIRNVQDELLGWTAFLQERLLTRFGFEEQQLDQSKANLKEGLRHYLNRETALLDKQKAFLQYQMQRVWDYQEQKTAQALMSLDAFSPLKTLSRGYSIVTDPEGHVVTSIQQLVNNTTVTLRLAEGEAKAVVTATEHK